MLGLVISFVGGLAWFAHAGRDWIKLDQRRRLRRGIMLATLVLAGVPTVFAAQAWQRHERDLEMLLIRMVQMLDGNQRDQRTRVRSALVQVSNGKLIEPEKLVLQVTQNSSQPLYLRGSVFNAYPYRTSTWVQERTNPVDLNPSPVPPGLKVSSKERVFQISSASSAPWTTATITYLAKDDPVPLAPLQTTLMQLNVSQLRIDTLGNLSLREESLPDTLTDYIPVSPGTDAPPEPDDPTRKLPATLDPRILAIAQTVFAGKTSDAEKIRAVEAYFRENFLYQLGWEPPPNVDPLTCFLVDRIPAHCEYFASGAAILLRTGGVPTRYITGYVPSEQHPGGVWIARRKDAHAWVEAYDAGLQRWVTVEPTPSQGLPERRTATWRNSFDEAWRVWSTRFRERLAKFGVLSAMLMVLESTITRVLLGVVLLAGWWGLSRRFRRRVATPRNAMTPRTFPFQQWLRLLESELEQRGFQRQPQETLLQFRDRILASPGGEQLRATAEWYAEYSSIRYNEAEQTDARVAALELSWQGLASKTGASTGVPSPNRK